MLWMNMVQNLKLQSELKQLKRCLKAIDLIEERDYMRGRIKNDYSEIKRKKYVKRLKLVEALSILEICQNG